MANSTLRKRFKEAQKVNFPGVEESSNTFIHDFIKAHCDAIGCPREFLFFPFLSTFAGFMGSKAVIKVHEEWKEPAILWSIIAACKGERKSPALKRDQRCSFLISKPKNKSMGSSK
ncbi:Hypothetical predicted protein [Mytilus galloprovincialis]|uniref:Uncharacterized protein n=1 Tax=Mytilus galloprovincialis TaxID=29158 RepID=A0A8B6BH00_MYTGA|nr:Hypothetical predicted protein [Mytilus galloprovincialis]